MGSTYGQRLKISVFGQSHGEAVGVVVDGFPAGFQVDFGALQQFLNRRAPGNAAFSTRRKEADVPQFLSGLVNGVTCGAPICAVIPNTDTRSGDYTVFTDTPRPAHADYTAHVKYGGFEDARGGGHFSGRVTAALCVAGGLCLQYLQSRGIFIGAHILSIAEIDDDPFPENLVSPEEFSTDPFPVRNAERKMQMLAAIENARGCGDSVGGVVECAALGVPPGLGDPMFDGLENRIATAIFAVPAVKGIEFGNGFAGSGLRGSENNDPFVFEDGKVKTATNHHGGILGGISSGMPILFRVAFKPTPSIAMEQQTVNLKTGDTVVLRVPGRHDPCVVPRAVPCVESACALALCDSIL